METENEFELISLDNLFPTYLFLAPKSAPAKPQNLSPTSLSSSDGTDTDEDDYTVDLTTFDSQFPETNQLELFEERLAFGQFTVKFLEEKLEDLMMTLAEKVATKASEEEIDTLRSKIYFLEQAIDMQKTKKSN
jgi:hypothetical protein